jgi:pimeloyl-ACP methyl ester carboxylesterase
VQNLHKHGNPPFAIAVIHGGPGAAREMAPVARALSNNYGVLEPLQTVDSLNGQIAELKSVLENNANLPITLIGFSWGVWLSYIFSAQYPDFVKKLILISSGPFEKKYTGEINEVRMSRLSEEERIEVSLLHQKFNDAEIIVKDDVFHRFGELFSKADAYDPLIDNSNKIIYDFNIFQKVWNEAVKIRKSGLLLDIGSKIKCSVVAIHGDYDPRPAEGLKEPLSKRLKGFRFILLENCGHKPWIEKQARNKFYKILKMEIIQ